MRCSNFPLWCRTPSIRSFSLRGTVPWIRCGGRRRHTDRYGAGQSWLGFIRRFACVHYWTKQKIEVPRTPRPRGQSRCAAPEPVLALRRNTTGPDADIGAGLCPATTLQNLNLIVVCSSAFSSALFAKRYIALLTRILFSLTFFGSRFAVTAFLPVDPPRFFHRHSYMEFSNY
jgi:hypothetical protein